MNVSYLLVTTAWLAGAEPTPGVQAEGKNGTAAPKAVVAHHNDGCCRDSCCDDWRGRLRDRFHGLFQRRDHCCEPCPRTHDCHQPRLVAHHGDSCCQTRDTCCERSWRDRLLERFRGLLQRRDRGCCDPCANGGAPAPRGEPIPPPKDKKMPKGTNEPTQLLNPGVPAIPFNTPALQTPPLAPQNPGNLERRDRDF